MLANGSSLTTVDDLPLEDAKALYETLRSGLWGPYGETYRNYNLYLASHMNKEVAVAVASGKKYKATQPIAFHDLYPIVDDYMTLGRGKIVRNVKSDKSLATQALMSIPTEGAPAWLVAAAKE